MVIAILSGLYRWRKFYGVSLPLRASALCLPMTYAIPDPPPWTALASPLAAAEDSVARLDERLGASLIREGWTSRTHVRDACASLGLAGALVRLEDLVRHDAALDLRAPTHDLTRAHAVLRTRRHPRRGLPVRGLLHLRSAGAVHHRTRCRADASRRRTAAWAWGRRSALL